MILDLFCRIKHVKEETSQKDGLENHANEEDEDRIVDYKVCIILKIFQLGRLI